MLRCASPLNGCSWEEQVRRFLSAILCLASALATAYAEVGRFEDAVAAAQRALDIALQNNQPNLAAPISERLELFKKGQPYRMPE